MYVHVYNYMCVRRYVFVHVYAHVYAHVYMHVCIYAHVYAYVQCMRACISTLTVLSAPNEQMRSECGDIRSPRTCCVCVCVCVRVINMCTSTYVYLL